MDWVPVIAYINSKLLDETSVGVKNALRNVLHLIDPKNNPNDISDKNKLAQVLGYLQQIQISEPEVANSIYYSQETFEQHIKKKNYLTLKQAFTDSSKLPYKDLSIKKQENLRPLENLYTLLMQGYKNEPHWSIDYPQNENGGINNHDISGWQKYMMRVEEDEEKLSSNDFVRTVRIEKNKSSSINDTENRIDKFVDKTNYSEEEKAIIKKWMMAKGGQSMFGFLGDFLKNGNFDPERRDLFLASAETIFFNWSVKEGKAYADIDLNVRSVKLPDNSDNIYLVARKSGIKRMTEDKYMDIAMSLDNEKNSPSIMNIKIEEELSIKDGVVLPKIVYLSLQGFTNQIIPESLQEKAINEKSPELGRKQ